MEELNSLSRFDVQYNDETAAYEFITDDNIAYTVTFIDYTSAISADFSVYIFGFERIPMDGKSMYGERIRNTVLYILSCFFEKNTSALVAVYDSLDGKQSGRKRLFDFWYHRFGMDVVCKKDGTFYIDDAENYAIALYAYDHPQRERLEELFDCLLALNFYN